METPDTPKRKFSLVPFAVGGAAFLLGLFFIFGLVGGGVRGCLTEPYAPSAVDLLRDGGLSAYEIKSVEFLQHEPGQGWPFKEADYAQLPRATLSTRAAVDQLASVLEKQTTDGGLDKNHPQCEYAGILKLNCGKKGHFYVYYELRYRDEYYVALSANSLNEANPNCAKEYYSRALVDFLQKHDPNYKGVK